jgi:peptide/nickel transport system ATP-binding protein
MASPVPRTLLTVEDLAVRFRHPEGVLTAVGGVSFRLALGETLCLLGESGSGKTVTMRALMRLLPPTARISGRVDLDGIDITALDEAGLEAIRGTKVSMIFQDPMAALDPVFTVGQQIVEKLRAHERLTRRQARVRTLELLDLVHIPGARHRIDSYPHELSGGLRQRVMVALALACRPKLLLADEPTTALDATVQIQILLLLREIQRELGMAVIIVTHDLGVACELADRITVMYAGRFVETGAVTEVIDRPLHPYTVGLLRSTLHAKLSAEALRPIPGAPPDLRHLPTGCAFAPRCFRTEAICRDRAPTLDPAGPGREARCHLVTKDVSLPTVKSSQIAERAENGFLGVDTTVVASTGPRPP